MDVKPQTDPISASLAQGAASPDRSDTKQGESDRGGSDGLFGFAWFLFKLVLLVLVLRIFVIAPFSIPSESMLPKLWHGDYLVATKWSYGYSSNSLPFEAPLPPGRIFASQPERGDVVIFKHPVDRQDYVKRVIGLPGDTVAMIGGQVVINGEFVAKERIADFTLAISAHSPCAFGEKRSGADGESDRCAYIQFRETLPGGVSHDTLDFGLSPGDGVPIATVPDGHMFVMGDNRDYSRDSRFPALAGDGVGMVPQDNLVGRVWLIFWSTDGSAEWAKPWTWFSAARWDRIGRAL
ncbi:MAG: signal peptidase I [Pseudomonadota bacterium]